MKLSPFRLRRGFLAARVVAWALREADGDEEEAISCLKRLVNGSRGGHFDEPTLAATFRAAFGGPTAELDRAIVEAIGELVFRVKSRVDA